MNQNRIKSTLEIQRIKSEMGCININTTVGKYQRNLELVRSGTSAAEKTLLLVIVFNISMAFSLLILNHLNSSYFNKEFTLNLISQFNIFLPLLMASPIILAIIKNFLSEKESDKSFGFSVIGKIVGTSTILTLVPFISIIISYLLKTQLI